VVGIGGVFISLTPTQARVVRGRVEDIIYSGAPLNSEDIRILLSAIRVRGFSISELIEKFFKEKEGILYLRRNKIEKFLGSVNFRDLPSSYPFNIIGQSIPDFISLLEDIRTTSRWQAKYPKFFPSEKFGQFAVLIALSHNIYYLDNGERINMRDPFTLSTPRIEMIIPIFLGNLFISGPARSDGQFRGKLYRIIDDEGGKMVMRIKRKRLSEQGMGFVEELFVKDGTEGLWIRWLLGIEEKGFVFDARLMEFLNGLIESNEYRRY
jgi:hypothetical protein